MIQSLCRPGKRGASQEHQAEACWGYQTLVEEGTERQSDREILLNVLCSSGSLPEFSGLQLCGGSCLVWARLTWGKS